MLSDQRQILFPARILVALMLATSAVPVPAQEVGGEEPEQLTETSDVSEQASGTSAPPATADVAEETGESQVMDRIELEATEVTGNRELPKVMVIVPWQSSDPGDLPGQPVGSLLDELPAPLDREEFSRQVESFENLYGQQE